MAYAFTDHSSFLALIPSLIALYYGISHYRACFLAALSVHFCSLQCAPERAFS